MKKGSKIIMAICMTVIIALSSVIPAAAAPVENFSDVPKGHWAYEYVNNMVRLGVITGYPDSTFKPEKYVSREEFAKILCGATKNPIIEPSNNTFMDVPKNHWSFKYVETVKDYLTGYPSNNGGKPLFKGTQDATREDVAVALVKIKGFDKTVSPSPTILDDMYKDVYSISSNLKNLMAIAVEKRLITGYPDGSIRGTQPVTRAEAAAIIDRANNIAGDIKVPSPLGGNNTDNNNNNSERLVYLSLECDKTSGNAGEKLQASAVAVYSNGKSKTVSSNANWKSLNEAVATVNGNGQIKLIKAGTAKIKVTFDGKTDEQTITVFGSTQSQNNEIKFIKALPDTKQLKESESFNIKIEAVYKDGKTGNVTNDAKFECSDNSIIKVSDKGQVTGLKAGTAVIKAIYQGFACYTAVTVEKKPVENKITLKSISFPYSEKRIKVGEKLRLQVMATYSDDSKKDITSEVKWSTSNDKTAKISATGELFGTSEGSAIITAQKDGKSSQIVVIVMESDE